MTVYILMNDYDVDAGATILGVFSTREKAKTAQKEAEEDFGIESDNMSITSYEVR